MSDPHSEKLLAMAAQAANDTNSAHARLLMTGDGGSGRPLGSPNPEAMSQAVGKAASLVLCYFGSEHKVKPDQWLSDAVHPCILAVFFACVEEDDPNMAKGFVEDKIKKLGWDKFREAQGVGSDSSFGLRVSEIKSNIIGGGGSDNDALRREQFAVVNLACIASAKVCGETDINNLAAVYVGVMNYMNHYWMGFGDQATPDLNPYSLDHEMFMKMAMDNYENIFAEINLLSPKTEHVQGTMFGFEDLTSIFQNGIDPQLMKDSELQTYRLRGEMVYEPWWWYDVQMCEDKYVPIKNPQGKITGYDNIGPVSFPCVDESRNAVPVTGTLFERYFVEAPPVSGTYDAPMMSYIATKTQEAYPPVAYYGEAFSADQPEYVDEDGRWITSYAGYTTTDVKHWITDASNYEPYYFINNHEAAAGNPGPGWGCSVASHLGGFCNNYHVDPPYYVPLNYRAVPYPPQKDSDGNWIGYWLGSCEQAGATYDGDGNFLSSRFRWVFPEESCLHMAAPSPLPFPGQVTHGGFAGGTILPVRDMSLRHPTLKPDADPSINYWDDHTQIEFTGFVMAPLMFTNERLSGLYSDHKTNPTVDFGNLGRRAFTYGKEPTCSVVTGTCGPPQQFAHPYASSQAYNYNGGPFVYGHVTIENKTKKQRCKVDLFPGWAYRYREDPYGTFDYHRTGGWNFPLITTAYSAGYSDPEQGFWDGEPYVEFFGTKISNHFEDRDFRYHGEKEYWGTGVYESWFQSSGPALPLPYDPDPPNPFHYNQDLITPQKFFGMGDGCQNTPSKTVYSLNAGQRYSFHEVDIDKITHHYLKDFTGEINAAANVGQGAEAYFTRTIMGQYGDSYWNHYVTGWINTGDYAGEAVSCMHPRTGYSIGVGAQSTRTYWWLGRGPNDVHSDFPFKGIDCLTNFGPLSPYPNYSKCCDVGFTAPFVGSTTTTTTTTTADPNATTTTTCDPSDPNCQGGGGGGMQTTTTTEAPLYFHCTESSPTAQLLTCPDGKVPDDGYVNEGYVCNWDQCQSAGCEVWDMELGYETTVAWDTGIFPHERGWVEQKVKQRGENPPRYWHGPYASTHFTFLYPHASGAMEKHYPENPVYEISGFPWRISFNVEIEEYAVRTFISGGEVNDDGIKWTEKVMGEDGAQPSFLEENTGYNWGKLVDENFVTDEAIVAGARQGAANKTTCDWSDVVLDYNTANGRNVERYSGMPRFDRGNQIVASGLSYAYGTKCEDAINNHTMLARGGYHRYTGYSFPITVTYAKPSYDLKTHTVDYSSIKKALEPGNELFYKCNEELTLGIDWLDNTLDPVYFMPMNSNLKTTGTVEMAYLSPLESTLFTGSTIHQKQIYGDHWMGVSPGSLFSQYTYEIESGYNGHSTVTPVAGTPGNLVTCRTGSWGNHYIPFNNVYDPATGYLLANWSRLLGGGLLGDDDSIYYCTAIIDHYGVCTGVEGPPALNQVAFEEHPCMSTTSDDVRGCDRRVYLFNLNPSGIDIHVRAPDYLSGYVMPDMELDPPTSSDLDALYGMGALTSSFSISLSGTDTVTKTTGIGGNLVGFAANNGNKKLDFFKRGWADQEDLIIKNETIIYEKEGILYEEPTEEWAMGQDKQGQVTGYETVLQHGMRISQNGGTKLKVSGFVETSRIKIKISGIKIDGYGQMPTDSFWSMEESGNCQVSGTLEYWYQNEAAIYSEGVVIEDKSVDPLRDVLNYPHYASETIKRPGVLLPTGAHEFGEYNPDFQILTKTIRPAPSKMVVRTNEAFTVGSGVENYEEIYRGGPHYYNRYVWPTMSDVADWNGWELSWESLPPLDRDTYPVSNLMICGAAGQPTADLENSELVQRKYAVTQHIAFYDSTVLDPTINTEWMQKIDTKWSALVNTSYLVPYGTTVNDIKKGLVSAHRTVIGDDDGDGANVVGILKGTD